MEWISVEDRLPELGKNVIVYYGNDPEPNPEYVTGLENPKDFDNEFYGHTITHWMPLPPPPTNKEDL